MSKEDLTWVVIRATGFLLTVRAVLYLPEMLSAAAWLWHLGDPSGSGSEGFKMSVDIQRQELISSAIYVVVYAAFGIYLLRKGAWIHRLLLFVRPEL
ncbi:MAG: hypothetical protein K0S03_724 [Burkholderiales bacterium]|jgi:hypothetical protein|nr:hypothetical protein [Burkholderiales bacterium]